MFKKKSWNILLDYQSNHDILSDYLVDYPKNVPFTEIKDDIVLEGNFGNTDDFNKLMFLLFNQTESNRFKKISKYVKCMNMKNTNYTTPLMMAAKMAKSEESIKILEFVLMNSDKNNINSQDIDGRSALMYACANIDTTSSLEACRLLIKNGANIDLLDDKGCNSIMIYALSYTTSNSLPLAKLLIDCNVNIFESSTNNKLNALMIACKRYDTTRDIKLISLLLDSGIDINHKDKYGNTALMQLCKSDIDKNFDLIKFLIDRKAKTDILNNNKESLYDILFSQKSLKKNDIINMILN